MSERTCTMPGCGKKHRARGLCVTHYNQTRYTRAERHPLVPTPCVICGAIIMRTASVRYQHVCSTACRTILEWGRERTGPEYDWAREAVRRARSYAATIVEAFTREEIFERDGLTCYLCGRPCDPVADTCNPASPTVDHVIALSNGGDHNRTNARTACLGCNSAKAARDRAPAA